MSYQINHCHEMILIMRRPLNTVKTTFIQKKWDIIWIWWSWFCGTSPLSLSFGLAVHRAVDVIIERERLIHAGSGYYHIHVLNLTAWLLSLSQSLTHTHTRTVVIYVSQIQIEHDSPLLRCPLLLNTFDPKRVSENESFKKDTQERANFDKHTANHASQHTQTAGCNPPVGLTCWITCVV